MKNLTGTNEFLQMFEEKTCVKINGGKCVDCNNAIWAAMQDHAARYLYGGSPYASNCLNRNDPSYQSKYDIAITCYCSAMGKMIKGPVAGCGAYRKDATPER